MADDGGLVVLHFTTTLRDPSTQGRHDEMVRQMRELAERTPGYLGWYEPPSDGPGAPPSGVLVFDSQESLGAWRDDPLHGQIHVEGEEAVYSSFDVTILEPVRRNTWAR